MIIFGFDASYYKYYGKELSQNICPDILYVAATGAKEKLILIQDYLENPLPFLSKNISEFNELGFIEMYPKKVTVQDNEEQDNKHTKQFNLNTTPTDLVAFIRESYELTLADLIGPGIEHVEEPSFSLDIPLKVETTTGIEDVSAINGIVIPMIQEERKTGQKSTVQKYVEQSKHFMKDNNDYAFLLNHIKTWDPTSMSIENDILLSILFICCSSKLYHKIAQINNRNWLSYPLIKPALDLLDSITSNDEKVEYEKKLEVKFKSSKYGNIVLTGRVDIITESSVWEVKCVESLTFEHELQLSIYQWIWKKTYEQIYGPREFKLINIRSGEIRKNHHDIETLEEMMDILMHNKYAPTTNQTNEEFIDSLKDIYMIEKEFEDYDSDL